MNLILLVLLISLSNPANSAVFRDYIPSERDGLLLLRDSTASSADLHRNWTGPPCIGDFSRWFGVTCSNWHVIRLVLDGIELTGSLPPLFLLNLTRLTHFSFNNNSIFGPLPHLTNLVNLQNVFLSFNRFTGSIPVNYTQLPNLRSLELQVNYLEGEIPAFDQNSLIDFNVSYNRLQGPIPSTATLRRFPNSSFDHNHDLCDFPLPPCTVVPPAPSVQPPPENTHSAPVWIIVLIAVSAVLLPFVVVFIFLCYYRNRQSKQNDSVSESTAEIVAKMHHFRRVEEPEAREDLEFFERNIAMFDLDDLLRASAEVLGKGKHGITYKANLELSGVFAVKRVGNMNELSKKEFTQQMQILGKLRHENLAKIISFYYSKDEKLVIYEFIPDGNLFNLLHGNRGNGRVALNWRERLSIIKDIAKGLAYLHKSLPKQRVPHANLKSTNVLVYKDGQSQTLHCKLTNYGFLPLLPSRKRSQTLAIGRSPEFSEGKKMSHKTDIYCFGIVLLEIITGRVPEEEEGERVEDLSDWVKSVVNNDWSTDILDAEILGSREGHDQMLKLTEIALECTDLEPRNRPKITQLLSRIEEIEVADYEDES